MEYYRRFDFMGSPFFDKNNVSTRQTVAAMVNFLDDVYGNLTSVLKSKGMWESTLIFLQSDNGGLSFNGKKHTGSNWFVCACVLVRSFCLSYFRASLAACSLLAGLFVGVSSTISREACASMRL